jgi:hypothetical protein
MTFDRGEPRAAGLIRDLTAWLLQQHLHTASGSRPDESRRIV